MALLETYLIGVETDICDDRPYIVVTDDFDGFGPSLLATYPLEKVDAETAEGAGWDYAYRHRLLPIRVHVNLSDEYGEWLMDAEGMHEV